MSDTFARRNHRLGSRWFSPKNGVAEASLLPLRKGCHQLEPPKFKLDLAATVDREQGSRVRCCSDPTKESSRKESQIDFIWGK